ncbi:MAG: WecB/TagA/CpsF family glycosyltransferase [Cellulosilyticaceae bacterium]
MKKIKILGVNVDMVTMQEAVERADRYIREAGFHSIFTPNPEIIMLAQDDEEMMRAMQQADLIIPDGIGVVIASKIQKGEQLPERVPGFDFVQETMKRAADKGYTYYFLGGKPGVAEEAKKKMEEKYPGIQIAGYKDGYFKEEDIPNVIEDINNSKANILLVCLGAPKQEKWIMKYKDQLPFVRIAVGAGGSLDGMAGIVPRAPKFYQAIGMEWLYRLAKQPSRWRRVLVIPQFLVKVVKEKNRIK